MLPLPVVFSKSLLIGLLAAVPLHASAQAVKSLRFATENPPPATALPPQLQAQGAFFHIGLRSLPERTLVANGLRLGPQFGLEPKQIAGLGPLLDQCYADMQSDPAFRGLPSALPYGFSPAAPTNGHYFVSTPAQLPEEPMCIVFLHGWGGNFQFYIWSLRQQFPNAVILVPSWGISWVGGSPEYIAEMLEHARKRLKRPLAKPWLIGISAGGRGGFSIYDKMSDKFGAFICIANAPTSPDAKKLRPDLRILMVNGTEDTLVPEAVAARQARLAHRRVRLFRYHKIEKGTHFFLLERPKETYGAIRKFMADIEAIDKKRPPG